MRYVLTRRSYIDGLQHRIRLLEVEAARHEWLKAQYHALERAYGAAQVAIRTHRCHPGALPTAAGMTVPDDNVIDIRGRDAATPEVNRVTD